MNETTFKVTPAYAALIGELLNAALSLKPEKRAHRLRFERDAAPAAFNLTSQRTLEFSAARIAWRFKHTCDIAAERDLHNCSVVHAAYDVRCNGVEYAAPDIGPKPHAEKIDPSPRAKGHAARKLANDKDIGLLHPNAIADCLLNRLGEVQQQRDAAVWQDFLRHRLRAHACYAPDRLNMLIEPGIERKLAILDEGSHGGAKPIRND